MSRRVSPWVETTYQRDGRELLLPVRARVLAKDLRNLRRGHFSIIQGEAWTLDAEQEWTPYKRFPRVKLPFIPTDEQLEGLAEAVADALVEWIEENDPEGLERLLLQAPEVKWDGEVL